MKVVIGIPARYGSTRFPGKPLCSIAGLSMIEHCYKRSSLSNYTDNVFIACCDSQIVEKVKEFKGNYILTPKNIERPGLRVACAAETLNLDDNDIIVVVQGDEPLVRPEMIDMAINPLLNDKNIYVSNLCAEINDEDMNNPSEVKVVTDLEMNALYFSRSPIPSSDHQEEKTSWWKQVCIMPFRWHFMKKFNYSLEPTPLEKQESIEMLRAVQHGYKVKMVPTKYITKSVDNEDDRLEAEKLMLVDDLYKTKYK